MIETGSGAAVTGLPFDLALLFTGHMIDRPGRAQPRFPAQAEARARAAIDDAVATICHAQIGSTVGLAGAASGGDLLFHEVCGELGIPTQVLLAKPVAEFVIESVAPAGPAWERRFYALLARLDHKNVKCLGATDGLIQGEKDNLWERSNLWMIQETAALAPERTLLALWDGKASDAPGGTNDFVQLAQRFGIKLAPVIDMQKLVRS
jgi:hypothetical protein